MAIMTSKGQRTELLKITVLNLQYYAQHINYTTFRRPFLRQTQANKVIRKSSSLESWNFNVKNTATTKTSWKYGKRTVNGES